MDPDTRQIPNECGAGWIIPSPESSLPYHQDRYCHWLEGVDHTAIYQGGIGAGFIQFSPVFVGMNIIQNHTKA